MESKKYRIVPDRTAFFDGGVEPVKAPTASEMKLISGEEIKKAWQDYYDKYGIETTREERLQSIANAQLTADQAVCSSCQKVKELEEEIRVLVKELTSLNMRPVPGGMYPEWAMSDKTYQELKAHYLGKGSV